MGSRGMIAGDGGRTYAAGGWDRNQGGGKSAHRFLHFVFPPTDTAGSSKGNALATSQPGQTGRKLFYETIDRLTLNATIGWQHGDRVCGLDPLDMRRHGKPRRISVWPGRKPRPYMSRIASIGVQAPRGAPIASEAVRRIRLPSSVLASLRRIRTIAAGSTQSSRGAPLRKAPGLLTSTE
jgi:hypothetical protein